MDVWYQLLEKGSYGTAGGIRNPLIVLDEIHYELIARVDKLQFQNFIRATACRTEQMLNIHDIASDVGVSDDTAKRWLQVLEKSDIIFYLRSYSNNLLKRIVKTSKLYFFDTGLVAYLTKYTPRKS